MIEELIAEEINERFKKLADTKISDLLSTMNDATSHPETQCCQMKMMCVGGLHPTEPEKCLLVIACNDPISVAIMKSAFEVVTEEMDKTPGVYSTRLNKPIR